MNETHTSPRFFTWLRGLGITRQSQDRWFTGLASGIAGRAGIDPLIVRGIFVVLTVLGGPGLLLYLFGWLFLPDTTGKIHIEELMRGRATPGVIVAVVLIAVWIMTGLFRWNVWGAPGIPGWPGTLFSTLLWIGVLIGVAYLLYAVFSKNTSTQHDSNAQEPTETHPTAHTNTHEEAPVQDTSEHDTASQDTTVLPPQPAAGTHPGGSQSSPPKRGFTLITLALALIAASIAAGWTLLEGYETHHVIIAALLAGTAVTALALIFAGIRGVRSSGVGVLGLLGAISLTVTALLPWGILPASIIHSGDGHTGHSEVAFIGDNTLDLRDYDGATGKREVNANTFAGDITVILPNERHAQINLSVKAGTIDAEGLDWREQTGVLHGRSFTVNDDGDGPPLTVNVSLVAGDITVIHKPRISSKDTQ